MKLSGWTGIFAAAVVALSGCEGDSERGAPPAREADEAAVRKVLAEALDALYDGDGARACSLYTRSYRRQLVKENQAEKSDVAPKGFTCEEQVRSFQPILKRFVPGRDVNVLRVRVSGDSATALTEFNTTRGTTRVKEFLIRQDGSWRINADQEAGEAPP